MFKKPQVYLAVFERRGRESENKVGEQGCKKTGTPAHC
jgi:hypothetical protein